MPTIPATRIRRSLVAIALVAGLCAATLPLLATPAIADPALPGEAPTTPELIDAAVATGEITEAQGALYLTWAFSAPARVPAQYVSDTPWRGTIPLLELQAELPELGDAPAAVAARAELRGTTFECPGTAGPLPQQRATKHFYVQYKASALQGLSIGQYATALETSWKTEIGRFGWAAPPRDPVSYPAKGRYPVRVENLGAGLYGYVTGTRFARNNPDTPWNDKDAVASCMVINRNFGPFPGSPLDALRATAAHEFNHSIQFGYGALTGFGNIASVFVEGLATWMEDEVFDSSNDSYNYLWPEFDVAMGRYRGAAVDDFPYPYWVVFRAMAERFGTGERRGSEAVYQEFWEQISRGRSTNLEAMDRAFARKNSSLADAYHDASVALRFVSSCGGSTAERFCLEEGANYASQPGHPGDFAGNLTGLPDDLDRTIANDFALHWVGLPTQADVDLTVTRTDGTGILRVSVACLVGSNDVDVDLIGTAGGSPATGTVDLSGCDEATAVVSNVRMTSPTPKQTTTSDYTIAAS